MVFMSTAVQYVVCAFFLFLENERDVCTAVLRQYYVQYCCTAVQ